MTAEQLRAAKCGLFSERDTTDEAFKYATAILGKAPQVVTALMVYHNTLLEVLAKATEDEHKPNN